jgi:lipopolysaccharide biosynthesis glycosyltransferase
MPQTAAMQPHETTGVDARPPARHPNAVALIADRTYLPFAFFVAHQLAAQPSRNFDILVFTIGCTAAERSRAPAGVVALDFELDARTPNDRARATYGRLGLLDVMDPSYEKVLYLDSDVWIAGRRISELFRTELGDYPLAAVSDGAEIMRPKAAAWIRYKRGLGLDDDTPYFNAGVLLINRREFVRQRIAEKAWSYITSGQYLGNLADQSALNAVLRGNWLKLSPIWNWSFAARLRLTSTYRPQIIHFIGSSKPWKDHRLRYAPRYRREMRRYLGEIGYAASVNEVPWRHSAKWIAKQIAKRPLSWLNLERRERRIRAFMEARARERG